MSAKELINNLLNILFPPLCVSCKKHAKENFLCEDCFDSIDVTSGFFCPKCRRRTPQPDRNCHPEEKFALAAITDFKNRRVSDVIHALKYERVRSLMAPISKIMDVYLEKITKSEGFEGFTIIPIPMHSSKKRVRGFNQAELISSVLSDKLGLPVWNKLLKSKDTKSQTETKNYNERESNIKGCFVVKNPEEISKKNILLVDDVFTSGATMREAVRVLKDAGVKRVMAFVL
ncbi:MAG: ComF family protein, partial [Patescibacteria group bacterium]